MIGISLKIILLFLIFLNPAFGQDKHFKIFSVYPNPSKGQTTIYLRDYNENYLPVSKALLQVYDIKGQLVKEITVSVYGVGRQISDTINLSELTSGEYILKIDLGIIYFSKVVVQK